LPYATDVTVRLLDINLYGIVLKKQGRSKRC
jgi:hypothetical protein